MRGSRSVLEEEDNEHKGGHVESLDRAYESMNYEIIENQLYRDHQKDKDYAVRGFWGIYL